MLLYWLYFLALGPVIFFETSYEICVKMSGFVSKFSSFMLWCLISPFFLFYVNLQDISTLFVLLSIKNSELMDLEEFEKNRLDNFKLHVYRDLHTVLVKLFQLAKENNARQENHRYKMEKFNEKRMTIKQIIDSKNIEENSENFMISGEVIYTAYLDLSSDN